MAKKHLTDAAVERIARPTKDRSEISDSEPGLFLRVTTTGAKSWMVIYRLPSNEGKRTERRRTVIGRFPSMGVGSARGRARELMDLARQGIDPEARRAAEVASAAKLAADAQAGSFAAVAGEYIRAMKAGQLVGGRKRAVTQITAAARERLLRQRVLPTIGDLPLREVTTPVVARLLAALEKGEGPVDETLKVIRGVFKFALSRGLFSGGLPTAGMTNRQARKKITRSLTDPELRRIWNATERLGWPFGSVVRLLMLTGQRKNEIAGLRWHEVDFDRKLLILSAERVKNRKGSHEVALTESALDILRDARDHCEARLDPISRPDGLLPSDFVFPSETGKTQISGWNKLKTRLDRTTRGQRGGVTEKEWRAIRAGGAVTQATKSIKREAQAKIASVCLEPWRIHDLRHTFITRCRDGDENKDGEVVWSAPIDVLQAAVNHEITVGVTRTYDHGDVQKRYRFRKRELMEWWESRLRAIVYPAVDLGVPSAA